MGVQCPPGYIVYPFPSANVMALQARLISPVAGTIYLRQVAGRHAAVWGKLYWVNDMDTTMNHNWHIHENAVSKYYNIYNMSYCSRTLLM